MSTFKYAVGSLALAVCLSGCGKGEQLADDMIGYMQELAVALESVHDEQSAKAAGVEINKICDKVAEWKKRAKDVKVTKSENDRIMKKLQEEGGKVGARIQQAAMQAGMKSNGEPSFLAALERWDASLMSLQDI